MDSLKMQVTSAMAASWLADQEPDSNRHVSRTWVEKIASDIIANRWIFNGQPIIFNGTKLLDGQHRLHAIVKANKPVESLVVRGVAPEAMDVIDSGHSRSSADVATLHGITSANKRIAVVRRINMLILGKVYRLSTPAILAYLNEWASDVAWAVKLQDSGGSYSNKKSAAFTAPFALARRTNYAAVEAMAARFFGEIDLHPGDPMLALHRYATASFGARERSSDSNQDNSLKAILAIKACLDGRKLEKISWKTGVKAESDREFFAQKWI